MNPVIPLTPQQQRRRRNNLLIIGGGTLAVIATLVILLIPDGSSQPATTEEAAALAAAPFPADAETAPPQESPTPADTEDNTATGSAKTGDAAKITETEDASGTTAGEGEEQEKEEDTGYTEEELAKLPRWQAEFVRLAPQQRVAFATAFTQAKTAYTSEQWTNCLALLSECEHIYNNSPNVWNLRSCALLALNELDEAETHINRSLELNENDSVALMCLSELRMLRKDYKGSIDILQRLRNMHLTEEGRALHDAFTFHQLLCHLMQRQEMEARALISHLTPLSDSPLYYYAEAAFCIYRGDGQAALEPLRSVSAIYGNDGATSSYRKWMNKCGLAEKYIHNRRR